MRSFESGNKIIGVLFVLAIAQVIGWGTVGLLAVIGRQGMRLPKINLRPAEQRDSEQIAAIYAPIVRDTFISFEIEPPSAEIMAGRIESIQRQHPWLVATAEDEVLGYAYASEHRQRAAYRWSVDVTAYVAEAARGRGVGRRLYGGLIPMLRAQGFRGAFAGIALPNDASVGLHEAVGFRALGIYKDVGFKLGAWRDVGWWRLGLSNDDTPPAEPTSFRQLREAPDFGAFLA
jgi:L-amino acid N-acyltransferase YncA